MRQRWISRYGWGLWIGLGLTLLAVILHWSGYTLRLELQAYDYYVRHYSRIPASDKIVHIDIDDDSLARFESWPWPRDVQGALIRILHDLGADRIVTDIVWAEPRRAEVRIPGLNRFADVEGAVAQINELSPEDFVFPDDELAGDISEAGEVYLSFYDERLEGDSRPKPEVDAIAALLRKDFNLSVNQLAQQLHVEAKHVEDNLPGIKRQVAEDRVQAVLTTQPAATMNDVHTAILNTPFDRETADRADILAAYHRQLSLRALYEKCPPIPEGLKGKIPKVQRVIPPVYKFTAGARGVGFVTFEPDPDGRTRHVPLLMEWDGRLVEQLGFRVARDLLNIRPQDLSIDGHRLSIAGQSHRIQLDQQGQMLINWRVPRGPWQSCFSHLPVTQVLRIYDARSKIAENNQRRQMALARAMRIAKDDTAYEGYRQQVGDMLRQERQARWARLQHRDAAQAENDAKRLRQTVENDQTQTIQFIAEQWAALQKEPNPNDPQIAKDYQRFQEANRLVTQDVAEIDRVNARIAAEQTYWAERLAPIVRGKVCFVGYTATAVADMVNTPSYSRMPGVLVHSNVLNNLLQGQFRTWSPLWQQLLVIAVFGVVISVLTATRGPRQTFFFVLLVIAVCFGLNAMAVFERLDHWVRLITALLLTFVCWAIIVLFRFLVTDRQKRQFSKAVSQYVSPAVAKQIAGSAAQLDLAPVNRVVTCFFSDLAGFTRMSERLGPEGTRAVLNPYLEAMSHVLHHHQALINKFMGDGIFAFFNPPILPCPEHQLAACEAALESQQALTALIEKFGGDEFRQMFMRIGIATGTVFVGDYGSENKLDYTCVGDTVNLASRLEAANKQFDSKILLAGSTYDVIRDKYVCRRLGSLQVVGQTVAVRVWELIGRMGQVNGDEMRFIELFDEAVGAFCERDWNKATAAFDRCAGIRPNDRGAARYVKLIHRYRQEPPPTGWNGAIELTEK